MTVSSIPGWATGELPSSTHNFLHGDEIVTSFRSAEIGVEREYRTRNKECRISKGRQAVRPSILDIPCSLFNIPFDISRSSVAYTSTWIASPSTRTG